MTRVNGHSSELISVDDRGLQYGDGLFETIAVKNGKLALWQLHWNRLSEGCQKLSIPLPNESLVLNEIEQLITSAKSAVIKLILTRGQGGRGYAYSELSPNLVIKRSDWPNYNKNNKQGIDLHICDTQVAIQPKLAGLKHLNRLENVLARNEWKDDKFADGLMYSTENEIIEGTMSNVFFVKQKKLLTPDLSRCGVRGVMRQHILNIAEKINIASDVRQLYKEDLLSADEMFVCNSLIGIWPVNSVGEKRFRAQRPVTQKLQIAIEDL